MEHIQKLSDYKILFVKNPSNLQQFAIDELLHVLSLCGIKINIIYEYKNDDCVLSIGNTDLFVVSGLKPSNNAGGGFNITTRSGNLFLYAAEDYGLINACYYFLEQVVGYKYYAKDCIKYDQKADYCVPEINVSIKPSFVGRNIDAYELYKDEKAVLRLRQNCCDANGSISLWSSLHDESLDKQLVPIEYHNEKNEKKGWWAQDKSQLCWTSAYYDQELYEIIKNNLIDIVKKEPDKLFYMIGQNDSWRHCTCKRCQKEYKKYGVSGVFLRLVNKLADDVKKFIDEAQGGREHYLCMFAYTATEQPPVKILNGKVVANDDTVIAKDNVMIRIAPIQSGLMYSHLDETNNYSSAFAFMGWKKVAKHFAVWDYGTDFSAYLAPFPDWSHIGDNLKMFNEYGAKDVLTQLPAHTGATAFSELKLFLHSELMWNATKDEKQLTEEFFDNYYQNASGVMKDYLNFLDKHYHYLQSKFNYKATIYVPLYETVYWPKSVLNKMRNILSKAIVISNDETVKRRIIKETLFYRFMEIEGYFEKYSTSKLKKMIDKFEKDSLTFGLRAVKNGLDGVVERIINRWRRNLLSRKMSEKMFNEEKE